jgi:hypothetical protein
MVAPPSVARAVALLLAIGGPATAVAAEDPGSVGVVDKVENEAKIVSAGNVVTAAAGVAVHLRDELKTGPEGRLKLTFRDGSELTLGEKASVVIDRYVYDPDRDLGETVLQATRGAFRFASGRIKQLTHNKIAVSTPMADIGVRGTEFWGGALDGQYGVLLLDGEVVVSNQAGSVILSAQGQGTDIASPFDPPGPARPWSEEKIAKAVATVALH